MSRDCFVQWGASNDQHKIHIVRLEQLEATLDSIELSSILNKCIYEVDLQLADIRMDDPILIQFLIGHPDRSSLLWHEDGVTMIAIEQTIPYLLGGIKCERLHDSRIVDPEYTRISPPAVREALSSYLLTGHRPDFLDWSEAEQD